MSKVGANYTGKPTAPPESVLASSTQNRTGVAASVENVGRSHLNYQPGSPTAATPSTSAATPPTKPNPSKVPISEMAAKAFTDGMARAKMEDVMKKLGLDKEELSKLSSDLKEALDEINNSLMLRSPKILKFTQSLLSCLNVQLRT